jgi:hypothetical protein
MRKIEGSKNRSRVVAGYRIGAKPDDRHCRAETT